MGYLARKLAALPPMSPPDDAFFMREALRLAAAAGAAGEVPVGAVVVGGGIIIGRGSNQTERLHDVTAHAEILAITAASQHLGAKYLTDCTLYVTLEPCGMCAGAIGWAQLARLVYGATDPRRGFARLQPPLLHPKTLVSAGLLGEECAQLLRTFFKNLRT